MQGVLAHILHFFGYKKVSILVEDAHFSVSCFGFRVSGSFRVEHTRQPETRNLKPHQKSSLRAF